MFGKSHKKHMQYMDQMIRQVEKENAELEQMLASQHKTNTEMDENIRRSLQVLTSIKRR